MSYFDQLQRVSEEHSRSVKLIYDPDREQYDKWYVTSANANGLYYAYHESLEKACHKLLSEMDLL